MPYHRTITITPADVDRLRDGGQGSLLVWHEATDRTEVLERGDVYGDTFMIIAGTDCLAGIEEATRETGEEPTDAGIASDLADIANDFLGDWPGEKALTPAVSGLRQDMAVESCFLVTRPWFRAVSGEYFLTDTYRSDRRFDVDIEVTTAFLHTSPTRVRFLHTEGRGELLRFDLGMDGPRPAMVPRLVSGAIEAALRSLPGA